MEELVREISNRAGISEEQAQQAVETVISFLKGRLPAPMASQIDTLLGSGSPGGLTDQLGQLGDLGGLFGKRD